MRLNNFEIKSIKDIVKSFYVDANVCLFGSRVDDLKVGGDIDLYITINTQPHFLDKPRILAALKKNLGEQKIDLIFSYPTKIKTLIDEEASSKGILL